MKSTTGYVPSQARQKGFTSVSFTRYGDYDRCPAFAAYKHLDKLPEPKAPALQRGIEIHADAEKYLVNGGKLPATLKPVENQMKALRKRYADQIKSGLMFQVEQNWAFTKDWMPTRWDDWNNCFLRVKTDIAVLRSPEELDIIDNKSGKFRPEKNQEYVQQLELYGVSGFALFPQVKVIYPSALYVDLGVVFPEDDGVKFTRSDEKSLRKTWEKRFKPMLNDRAFKPKPGAACRYCPYSCSKVIKMPNGKEMAGPCKF